MGSFGAGERANAIGRGSVALGIDNRATVAPWITESDPDYWYLRQWYCHWI